MPSEGGGLKSENLYLFSRFPHIIFDKANIFCINNKSNLQNKDEKMQNTSKF